ncbi:MAG: acetyltransferase [Bdellovibrionota bacterium]
MKKLIIFGATEQAQVAHYYFRNHTDYQVTAFTVDSQHLQESSFCGLPVVPFENLLTSHSTEDHEIFIAIGYNRLNQLRAEKYLESKNKGYSIASYISDKANIFTKEIGENAFILEDNTIQPFVKIGNNVTLWSGNHIGHHSIIEDHVFVTSHVVVAGGVRIGEASFLGINATIRDHIQIGKRNIIGANAVILESTPNDALYASETTPIASIPSSKIRNI